MSFFESLVWYSTDLLVDFADFLITDPVIYIVGLIVLFVAVGVFRKMIV